MKKGPLSKKEKNYISRNYTKKEPSEIAEKLDRSENVVNKYINKITEETPEPAAESPPEEEKKEPQVHDVSNMFARNRERGVTVMTEAAASASDDNKQARKGHQSPPRYHKHIHRIKD